MTMKTLAAVSTIALCAAGAAQAQTLDWSGPYVGGGLGYGWDSNSDDETVVFDTDLDGAFGDTVNTAAGADAFGPGFCSGAALGAAPGDNCVQGPEGGFDLSVHGGYDWQFNNWVVGLLGEFAYTNVSNRVSAFSTAPDSYSFNRRMTESLALRARAGYAFGAYLPYVTGGIVTANVDKGFTTTNGANSFTVTEDDNAVGYQFGGGVERRLSENWSVGLEYLRTELDGDDYTVRAGDSGTTPATNPFLLDNAAGTDMKRDDDFSINSVRVKASYRF